MKQVKVRGFRFESAREAVETAKASGTGQAITIAGQTLIVTREEADRLAAEGVSFAYLCVGEMPDGTTRIVTVPVN